MLLLLGCADHAPRPSADPAWNVAAAACPAAPSPAPPADLAGLRVITPEREIWFDARIARSDAAQERGLAHVRALPLASAMLFPSPLQDNRFWMKDTCIPLDMVWAVDGRVVGVQTAPALEEQPRGVETASDLVIELGAGVAAANGIAPGARVEVVE